MTTLNQPHVAATAAPSDVRLMRRGPIVGIDGLRAICVGIVMIAHYGLERFVPGGLGVTAFFFISGFLITTLLMRETSETGTVDVGSFYARRLLRLHPELLAYVLISGYVLSTHAPPLIDTAAAIFYFTNYLQIFTAPPPGGFPFPHLWSLAVEEHYYLTYPLLFVFLMRRKISLWPVLIVVCLVSLGLRQLYDTLGYPASYGYLATETRIDSIAYGCLTSLLLWHQGHRIVPMLGGRAGLVPVAVGLLILLFTLVYRDPWFRDTIRYSLQGLALLSIMVGLQASVAGGRIARLLDNPPMRWMGQMSYAAYLWHLQPENWLKGIVDFEALRSTPFGMVAVILGLSAMTFAIAWVSHLLIYRSFLGLRRRFGSHAS